MVDDPARYRDMAQRIAVFSDAAGGWVRGDREALDVVDGDEVYRHGESEVMRVPAHARVFGLRSTDTPGVQSFGPVLDGGAILVVTDRRLIVELSEGWSLLGPVGAGEIHVVPLPLRLFASISIPAKRSLRDRIAGARTVELYCDEPVLMVQLVPGRQALIGGATVRVGEGDVAQRLIDGAVATRTAWVPEAEKLRLGRLRLERLPVEDGDLVAWLVDDAAPVPGEPAAPMDKRLVSAASPGSNPAGASQTAAPGGGLRGSLAAGDQRDHVVVPPRSVATPAAGTFAGGARIPATHTGGWFPDPAGRHEFRWWDGAGWTRHVSDHGVAALDQAEP